MPELTIDALRKAKQQIEQIRAQSQPQKMATVHPDDIDQFLRDCEAAGFQWRKEFYGQGQERYIIYSDLHGVPSAQLEVYLWGFAGRGKTVLFDKPELPPVGIRRKPESLFPADDAPDAD